MSTEQDRKAAYRYVADLLSEGVRTFGTKEADYGLVIEVQKIQRAMLQAAGVPPIHDTQEKK